MRKTKWIILLALLSTINSCATYDFESKDQHNVNLDEVFQIARQAVEKQFKTDLSKISWELADEYRLNRLAYKSAHDEYKVMINQPFYARLLSSAVSSISSDNVLGRYKDNLKRIYINPEEMENSFSYDLKDRDVAKQLYLALFIHEFVHAADFELFADDMRDEIYSAGQSELLSALLEGNAEYLSEKLCAEYNCEEGYDILENGSKKKEEKEDSEESTNKRKLSKLYKEELKFRYGLGKEYIAKKYQMSEGVDPMPRKLSELPNSQMLILYPENKRLINSNFTTVNQMMSSLEGLKSKFSNEGFIYHYEVFSPPRVIEVIKSDTGVKLPLARNDPPYLQAVTLKVYDMSDESYLDSDNFKFFMLLLDMGEELKSQKLVKKVADSWKTNTKLKKFPSNPSEKIKDISYVTHDNTMMFQTNTHALLVFSKKNDLNDDLFLELSENIFNSL